MIHSIINFSIGNRWLVVLLTLGVAAFGAFQLRRLPIDAVPDITNTQVQINAIAPALSPLEVEKQITFVLETSLSGIPGLRSTRSLSRNGFAQVTAVFDDGTDIYFARQQVAERLREADRNLPIGVETVMGPVATGLGEIYMYTVEFEHPGGKVATTSLGRPGWQPDGSYLTPEGRALRNEVELASYLREVQDWIIRPQLRSVRDVAGIDAIGGYVKQYHVQPDPMKLIAYGLTFGSVIEALERNNISTGAGYVERAGEAYLVRGAGRLSDPAEIGAIPIDTRRGIPITIADVCAPGSAGNVGAELRTGSASENGQEVVIGTAIMLLGANSREVAAAVDTKVAEIQRTLPPGIRMKTVLNRTKLVDATIATVRTNLLEGAALVVIVLLLLLGNWRAALLCAAAIPLAMLFTAAGMVRLGISGNLMSLGAIDFGLIVDGAVIIVENSLRRLALSQHKLGRTLSLSERLTETASAAREVARPSVFGQAIILTVYFPILALSGIEGKMFHPMAITVMLALLGAFLLSLTFVPAMVAICITGTVSEKEMFLVRWSKAAYSPLLRFALRARFAVVALAALSFVGTIVLFSRLGQEFVPTLDEHDLAVQVLRPPGTSLGQAHKMQIELERLVSDMPEVDFVFSKTGTAELASDPMPPNITDTFVILKPRATWRSERELAKLATEQREQNARDGLRAETEEQSAAPGAKGALLELIRAKLATLPGQAYEFTQPIQMRFNELISGVRGDVAVKIYGDDFESLQKTAASVLAALKSIPGAVDARAEQTEGLPMLTVEPNRAALARRGVAVAELNDILSIAVGGREAGQIFEGDRRFDIVVRLPDALRARIDEIERLQIPLPPTPLDIPAHTDQPSRNSAHDRAPPAAFAPLNALATVEVTEGTNQISRENGKRRIVVQANVQNRDLGSFVAEARERVSALQLPSGQWLSWGGQYENLVEARARLSLVVPACFVLIFFFLYAALRSVRDSMLVFVAVPLALTGGVLALWLRDMPFSISAAVGFIALSGIAVLNGLVMITFIRQLIDEGRPLAEGIFEGSLARLRPVLMTALVASLGFVPMALARGTGAEVQRPLATVVVGGLITSTLLTLLVLPALYRIFGRSRTSNP